MINTLFIFKTQVYVIQVNIQFKQSPPLRACSHGRKGPRGGEVPHLSVVKKYLSSHAAPKMQSEVQNATARSHVTLFSLYSLWCSPVTAIHYLKLRYIKIFQ